MVKEISEATFESEVLKNKGPVVVDFWAPWCGPCKMIAPVFDKLSKDMTALKFAKINVDENQDVAQRIGILGIPCMVIFKGGEEIDRIVGFLPEDKLKARLAEFA